MINEAGNVAFSVLTVQEQLMNAVRDLIFRERKEFNDITIMDICRKAKISRRTFYRYYKNKTELIYAMSVHDLNGFEEIIDHIIGGEGSAIDKLRKIQNQLMKTFFEDFTEIVISHFETEAPELWEMNRKRYSDIIRKITTVVKQGIQDGVFKDDIDPNMVLYLLYCCSESGGSISMIPDFTLSRSQMINEVFNILLYGIVRQEKR